MEFRKNYIFNDQQVLVQDANNLDQSTSATAERHPPSRKRKASDGDNPEPKIPRVDTSAKKPRKRCRIWRKHHPRNILSRVARAGDKTEFEERYHQFDLLGAGGFGSVFAGERKADQLPVAIKHIPRNAVNFSSVVIGTENFQIPLEVVLQTRAAPRLDCLGQYAAVSLLEWFDVGNEVILVMERPTSCVDLIDYDYQNPSLPEDQVKVILGQLVDALTDLHSKGIFHRDIKMDNILIQTRPEGPRVRIIDFGCGCDIQTQPCTTLSGTEQFTPPEFFIRQQYTAEPTTVWQIGAVMYNLLRKDQAFTTMDFMEGKLGLLTHISPEAQHFLQGCLMFNVKHRMTLEQLSLSPWL